MSSSMSLLIFFTVCFYRIPQSVFNLDSSYEVTPPTVDRTSKAIYEKYVQTLYNRKCPKRDYSMYYNYVRQKTL